MAWIGPPNGAKYRVRLEPDGRYGDCRSNAGAGSFFCTAMLRAYLDIPRGRDRGHFGAGLGAEDAVYFTYTRTKVTTPCAEIARSRRVADQKRASALLPSLPSLQAWLRRDA